MQGFTEEEYIDLEVLFKKKYPFVDAATHDRLRKHFFNGALAYKEMLELNKWKAATNKGSDHGFPVHAQVQEEGAPNFDAVDSEEINTLLSPPSSNTGLFVSSIPKIGIAVDCGSMNGKNPGRFEYRLVDIATKKTIINVQIPGTTTNNIAEFLAAIHGIGHVKANNLNVHVWSDSKTALSWIRNRGIKTKFTVTDPEQLDMIKKSCDFVRTFVRSEFPRLWITSEYGDIPADYGRKSPRLPNNGRK